MKNTRPSVRAQTRVAPLMVVCFALGIGIGVYVYHRATHHQAPNSPEPGLTESSTNVLRALRGPIDMRLYSSLDPGSTSEAMHTFARRVDQLLARYEAA